MSRFRLNISKLKKLNNNGILLTNADMSKYCTYKCGGKVKFLLMINTIENFIKVMQYLSKNNIPYFVLGNGSNILVSDRGYKGVVIKLGGDFARIEDLSESSIECGAGVKLSQIYNYCLNSNLSGIEEGAGIPATIGGAVYMNASAYSYQTAELIEYVVAYVNGKIEYFDNASCGFGYRKSVFQNNGAIILRVGLKLTKADKTKIADNFKTSMQKRIATQPLDKASAGCVFKRQENIQVSKLIDEAGLKGLTIGQAQVSYKHANFIVNLGGATAQDIYDLIQLIKVKIKDKYGIEIESEIKFIGEFR